MKNFYKPFLVIFFLNMITGTSQNNKKKIIDSLSNKTYKEIDSLFYDAGLDSLSRLYCAKALLKKAIESNDTINISSGYYFISIIKKNDSIYINHCDSLINLRKNNPNNKFSAYGYYQKGQFYFHKANYNLALKMYLNIKNDIRLKETNPSLYYKVMIRIALSKSFIGKRKESVELLKDIYESIKDKDFYKNDTQELRSILLNISLRYLLLNEYDSAYNYNLKALNYYDKIKDSGYIAATYFCMGNLEHKRKNYKKAEKHLQKAIPEIIKDTNFSMLITIYSMLGDIYTSLNTKNSLDYYLKSDSISKKYNIIKFDLKRTYKFLINYYKSEGNSKKQLTHINNLLKVNEVDASQKINISKTLTDEYDTPKLLEEKKKIEQELEYKLQKAKTIRYAISSFLLIALGLLSFQFYKRRKYKKLFLEIVNTQQLKSEKVESSTPKKTDINISQDIIDTILKALTNFEKNNDFLDSKVSLNHLAKSIHTNSNYLSKVINHYKNKSFSNYINDLRIKYTIDKLKNDSQFKKYSIKGISEEVGFKNAESFSKAFEKNTALKPSYFIKELEKMVN